MKFDYIVGNPPYSGTKQLHQRVFNIAVDLLKDDGQLVFIQPAYPYQNNKESAVRFKHNSLMIENINKYLVDVKIVSGRIFDQVDITTDLAITTLTKTVTNSNVVEKIQYKNGQKYENVGISDICFNQTPPHIFRNILQKYKQLISTNGCLQDLVIHNPKNDAVSIAKIRGDRPNGDILHTNFFTFFSKEDVKRTKEHKVTYGLKCKLGEEDNMYSYLSSNVARYGLSMSKIDFHCANGQLKLVPIVDFSKKYTEQELYDLLALTQEEIAEIKKVIK